MTADVVSWLTATLDEVERENTCRADGGWSTGSVHAMDCAYSQIEFSTDDCSCGRPAWALAAVEADRAILAEHSPEPYVTWTDIDDRGRPNGDPIYDGRQQCRCCLLPDNDEPDLIWPCRTVLLVASRYRHRPGYQEGWKP